MAQTRGSIAISGYILINFPTVSDVQFPLYNLPVVVIIIICVPVNEYKHSSASSFRFPHLAGGGVKYKYTVRDRGPAVNRMSLPLLDSLMRQAEHLLIFTHKHSVQILPCLLPRQNIVCNKRHSAVH